MQVIIFKLTRQGPQIGDSYELAYLRGLQAFFDVTVFTAWFDDIGFISVAQVQTLNFGDVLFGSSR